MTKPNKKRREQAVLSVHDVQQVSPHLIRITVGGDGLAHYEDNDFTDKYVKLLLADPAHGLQPPYDLAALRESAPDRLPARRTYTVRRSDMAAGTLDLDFVVHGPEGVAGPWAMAARRGDPLVLTGAGGKYRPRPDADGHLLVGDHSALPAISAAIEAMPPDALGRVILLVPEEDRVLPELPPGINLQWADGDDDVLTAVDGLDWLVATPQVFVHGERGLVKAIRGRLKSQEIPRELLSISAYWARGRAEDQFQAEKREPIGQID